MGTNWEDEGEDWKSEAKPNRPTIWDRMPRCVKCGMPQFTLLEERGPVLVCRNKRCGYREEI